MSNSFKHPDVVDVAGMIESWWRDLVHATMFLTRLPVAVPDRGARRAQAGLSDAACDVAPSMLRDLARATPLFPLVGAAVGVISAFCLLASFEIGLHPMACAFVALAVAAAVTGALHEDGLADFFDGLGGGRTREERLMIMRDSRIGTFGTLALIFAIGVRAAMLSGLSSPEAASAAIVAAATLSRAVLPSVMRWQRPARAEGLAVAAGMPNTQQVVIAAVLGMLIALFAVGLLATVVAALAALLASLLIALIAQRALGGHTGDVLGAVQVLAEVAILAAIVGVE